MESSFDLFKIDGFDPRDLQPSLAQAGWALNKARKVFRKQKKGGLEI